MTRVPEPGWWRRGGHRGDLQHLLHRDQRKQRWWCVGNPLGVVNAAEPRIPA